MPPLILIKLASSIVGNRLAKAGAWVILALAIIIALAVTKCTYDRDLIERHDAAVTDKTLRTDTKAKEEASERRSEDAISIGEAKKGRDDAIRKAPEGRPDDARNRLNCERLRRQGTDTSGLAACT